MGSKGKWCCVEAAGGVPVPGFQAVAGNEQESALVQRSGCGLSSMQGLIKGKYAGRKSPYDG